MGQKAPQTNRINYLAKLVDTERTSTGRPLLPQELARYRRELDQLRQVRPEGIQTRRHIDAGNERVIQAVQATGAVLSHESRQQHEQTHRMLGQLMQRMDTSWGAQDSSEDLHRRYKLQKKRERDEKKEEQKELQLFQVGIQPEQGDEFLGVVLVKANSERQMERLEGRDLGAQICCCGLSCRLVLVGPDYGLLQLVAPVDLAKLKATTPNFAWHEIELLAVHKKEVHTGLLWKEHRTPQLLFRDGEKVPKQAVLRLRVPQIGEKIARQLPLAEEPPAKRPALSSKAVPALTFEPIAEAFPEPPETQAMEELEEIPEPEKAPEAPVEPAEAAEPEKAPEAPVEPPEEAVPEKALELYEMPMGGKMLRFYFLRTELVRRITHAVVKLHGAEDHALLETRRDAGSRATGTSWRPGPWTSSRRP